MCKFQSNWRIILSKKCLNYVCIIKACNNTCFLLSKTLFFTLSGSKYKNYRISNRLRLDMKIVADIADNFCAKFFVFHKICRNLCSFFPQFFSQFTHFFMQNLKFVAISILFLQNLSQFMHFFLQNLILLHFTHFSPQNLCTFYYHKI